MTRHQPSWALIIVLGIGLFAGPALASCTNNWPLQWQMPIKSSYYSKGLKEVLGIGGFYPIGGIRNTDNRLSFRSTPGGKAGIRMHNPRGENAIVSFDTVPLGIPGAERACISADVYFPNGFDWNTAGTKLGVGLWGGQSFKSNSGGIPPQLQEGWSVRIINSARGARGYAYHLNRDGKSTSESRCKPHRCQYGETMGNYVKLRKGVWNNIQIEVRMNTVGSANGILRIWINGQLVTSSSNIVWRKKASWGIAGLKFTDMWGGDTSASKNFSPRNQQMFYRNFRLYADKKRGVSATSTSVVNRNDSSNAVSANFSSSFGPVVPKAGQTVENLPKISWNSHASATRYRVRLVDKGASSDRLLQIYSANEVNCANGGVCEIAYKGKSLRFGRHRLILRALNGSKNVGEKHFDFVVGHSGIQIAQASTSSSSGGSSPTSSNSGSLKAIFPKAGQSVASFKQITWAAQAQASRYRVRLVDKTTGKDRLLKIQSASQLGCNSGGTCQIQYDGGALRKGRHRLIVKALDGSRLLREVHFDFNVS